MKEQHKTLIELIAGIIIWLIIMTAAGILFIHGKNFFFGVLLGSGVAVILTVHMYISLDRSLDLGEDYARKYNVKMSMLRTLIVLASIMAAAFLPGIFNIIGLILGIMGLKFSAYLQPVIHKYILNKIFSKGR